MTGTWITCMIALPVTGAVAFAAGWSVRRSRCLAHEVKSWQAGWDMGWEAARKPCEGREP